MPNYDRLPQHIRYPMKEYVENGYLPGDFLMAVLTNNLKLSFMLADNTNREQMFEIVSFLYHEIPAYIWGSEDAVFAYAREKADEREIIKI